MSLEQTRQEIQKQKELPTLSPDVQRILTSCENPTITQNALADTLSESPTIAARLLGLANSSFFGQQGQVHSLTRAISVLGMTTVRSVAVGLALSGEFTTGRCPGFDAGRYWESAVMTALMSSALHPHMREELRPPGDSIYMTGLLHNIGLLALVHLYPDEMNLAFAAYAAQPQRRLGEHIRSLLDIDHYQAGIWLGSKWHLPEDILLVMQYHYDREYRGAHWPLVLLEGVCSRWAGQLIDGAEEIDAEAPSMIALGIPLEKAEMLRGQMRDKVGAIQEIASLFGKN